MTPAVDSSRDQKYVSQGVGAAAAVVALSALGLFAYKGEETGSPYAAAILAISLLFDVLVLRRASGRNKLADSLSVCELLKVVFLCAYCFKWDVAFAGFAIAVAIATAAAVMAVVGDLPQASKLPDGDLAKDLARNQLRSLCWVMAAFLHTAYFLSFAFAMHDRHTRDSYIANQKDAQPSKERRESQASPTPPTTSSSANRSSRPESDLYVANSHSGQPSKQNDATPGSDACQGKDERVKKIFSFESSGTLPPCTRSVDLALRASSVRTGFCEGRGLAGRMDVIAQILESAAGCADKNQATEKRKRKIATWNVGEIEEIRELLEKLATDDANKKKFLVEIRGHANLRPFVDPAKTKISPAYQSNYELSKRRAEAVAVLVRELEKDAFYGKAAPRMEPVIYGVSNEDDFLDPEHNAEWPDREDKDFDRFLSTEVRVIPLADTKLEQQVQGMNQEPRTLDLIDYLYFTFYTITTTGYGDIIPISGFAKLLVTIANLLEVLFVYVIINVVSTATAKAKEDSQ